MGLAVAAVPSVHARVAQHLIYVRRSYKESTAADVSDEMQETACRALLPAGASVRVISDSGGHQSGSTAARDGYQALLRAVAAGEAAAIVVYDLSRLARNARLMLDLHHELERQQVPLLVANMPGARFDGATGRYMYGQLCLAAQLQRDLDSERMTRMQHQLFEAGRHRGHDPLGYRSLRDATGNLVHPRELVIAPEEAAVVRRVWLELVQRSLVEVAELMNREGVPHRGVWNRESVKDIARRGRMYLGFVVEKRGRDERPGRHEPIISEAEYRRTMAAIASRRRVGNKPRPFRSYALRGLLHCSCGTRMRGEAHLQRGTERRYYRCPTLGCRARRSPADLLEEAVLATIAEAVLPGSVIDVARTELRRRLETPEIAVAGRQRARLLTRLEQLKKQHGWGDLGDAEYQAQRDAVRTALAALPDEDRVRSFDAYRARILALPEAIAVASGARREELCRIVVERVVVRDRQLETIDWTPPARPFFEKQRACPQGALGTRPLSDDADLAWYVA
jgi:DNA invertase Pin-like site-specific DNA recombinase